LTRREGGGNSWRGKCQNEFPKNKGGGKGARRWYMKGEGERTERGGRQPQLTWELQKTKSRHGHVGFGRENPCLKRKGTKTLIVKKGKKKSHLQKRTGTKLFVS